ncbi:MAG: hypothetical protein ACLVB4_03450 [Butyricicoccus sp.]
MAVSARAAGHVNAAADGETGGGGNHSAAGAQLKNTTPEEADKLITDIRGYFDDHDREAGRQQITVCRKGASRQLQLDRKAGEAVRRIRYRQYCIIEQERSCSGTHKRSNHHEILKADVKGKGKKGELIEVSEGYGQTS